MYDNDFIIILSSLTLRFLRYLWDFCSLDLVTFFIYIYFSFPKKKKTFLDFLFESYFRIVFYFIAKILCVKECSITSPKELRLFKLWEKNRILCQFNAMFTFCSSWKIDFCFKQIRFFKTRNKVNSVPFSLIEHWIIISHQLQIVSIFLFAVSFFVVNTNIVDKYIIIVYMSCCFCCIVYYDWARQ